jgi:hypothetical protein
VTRWLFWFLLGVNVLFSLLVFAALPFGPDLIYLVQAGTMTGAVALTWRDRDKLSPPPPDHPVWGNPRAPH